MDLGQLFALFTCDFRPTSPMSHVSLLLFSFIPNSTALVQLSHILYYNQLLPLRCDWPIYFAPRSPSQRATGKELYPPFSWESSLTPQGVQNQFSTLWCILQSFLWESPTFLWQTNPLPRPSRCRILRASWIYTLLTIQQRLPHYEPLFSPVLLFC